MDDKKKLIENLDQLRTALAARAAEKNELQFSDIRKMGLDKLPKDLKKNAILEFNGMMTQKIEK